MRVAAALLILLAGQEPAPKPGDSRIRRVTVYPDRALVVREAAVQAPAGVSLFEVRDLPANSFVEEFLDLNGTIPA